MIDRVGFDSMNGWPVFVVADCTGHGVPGAMLSVMCNSLLTQAFVQHDFTSPSDILECVRLKLAGFFNTQNDEILDGMDAAVALIDVENGVLHYAGANRPLRVVRKDELMEFKGDRQHVGHSEHSVPYSLRSSWAFFIFISLGLFVGIIPLAIRMILFSPSSG